MRERTTIDAWEILCNYGDGWEHECTEFTLRQTKQRLKEYRENSPGSVKSQSTRIKKSDLEPWELETIEEQKSTDRRERIAARLK